MLYNGLEQLRYFISSEIFDNALVVEINTHWLVIKLAKSLGSQENPTCRANWANMRMLVISSEGDLLPVLMVLLNSKSDSQLLGNFCKAIEWMYHHEASTGIVELPIRRDKSLDDIVTRGILKLIDFSLGLLGIFRNSESSYSYQVEEIKQDRMYRILWGSFGMLGHLNVHFFCQRALLPGNALLPLTGLNDFR